MNICSQVGVRNILHTYNIQTAQTPDIENPFKVFFFKYSAHTNVSKYFFQIDVFSTHHQFIQSIQTFKKTTEVLLNNRNIMSMQYEKKHIQILSGQYSTAYTYTRMCLLMKSDCNGEWGRKL